MRWNSLRLRLVAGGIVAILLALMVAGAGLILLFERHVARTLAEGLDVHLQQLLAGIDVDAQGHLVVTRPPADPRFADPLSGLYWQVSDDRGDLLRSRSLWDTTMALPVDEPAPGEVHRTRCRDRAALACLSRNERSALPSAIGACRCAWPWLPISRGCRRPQPPSRRISRIALVLLALVLAVATSIQVGVGLRPLDPLRRGVADIRAGRSRHLPSAVPVEVRPLVEEVNALLDAQEREIERSRCQAADLAHGLKTPLAALAADAARLREHGEHAIAQDVEAVGETMSRHVDRELARARVRGGLRRGAGFSTELAPLVRSLLATLARTPVGMRVAFEPEIADDIRVPLDRTDLAEVLGNLLENAARHAASRVRIAAGCASAARRSSSRTTEKG